MKEQVINSSSLLTLLAGITVTTVLGSIHAFSVFLQPLESQLQAGRAEISLIYSGALICLTIGVLLGHRIYPMLSVVDKLHKTHDLFDSHLHWTISGIKKYFVEGL